jgi:hypothetical protein
MDSSHERMKSFLENKCYFIVSVIICLFYFLDVFIGMFIMNNDYTQTGSIFFEYLEKNYSMI